MATKTIKIGLSDADKATMKTQIASDVLDEIVNGEVEISGSETNLTELKADIDDAVDTVNGKANVDGNYPTMTVGNADQLNSPDVTTDQVPYLYRTSGGDADIGNREKDTIVGGSLGWNQLIPTTTPSQSSGGITFTNNGDGSWTLSGVATTNVNYHISDVFQMQGHKVLLSLKPTETAGVRLMEMYGFHGTFTTGIVEATNADARFDFYVANGTDLSGSNAITVMPQVFDLTATFGPTIADYIYSLETATYGAGVAWFRKLFPKPYYPYKAIGGFLHVKLTSHDMVMFNQSDEEWEVGNISGADGQNVTSSNTLRSTNYIKCIPSSSYYFKGGTTLNYVFYYDAEKAFISYEAKAPNTIFTPPSNCSYVRFRLHSDYGTTYNHDICINLSWSGWRNGQYEAHKKVIYPLDTSVILRGIPKLDADNNLYYDGDRYESTGKVTRKFGIVDLGTLNWEYYIDNEYFSSSGLASVIKKPATYNGVPNMVCAIYETSGWGDSAPVTGNDKTICVNFSSGSLGIKDLSYTDAATFKAALSGVYLVYELAESTEETADPFQETQEVDDFGTEEYVVPEQDGVSVPVGHYTEYPENLRDKLRRLPNMPTVSESTTATYAVNYNGQTKKCSFVPINDWLVANGYPTGDALKEVLASKEALGGTLRQLLAVSKSIDFANTAWIDLGDINYTVAGASAGTYYGPVSGMSPAQLQFICSKYKSVTYDDRGTDISICVSSGLVTGQVVVYIHDSSLANKSVAEAKTALKGVLLAYEKASS